jgi:hypothetical protein
MKYYKLDKDTKAYLKRMAVDGIKTPADIYSVNDFVVGLKDLNLWGSIIFWPLRSNQNAGSGNIVYSLGGLGTYNGTLANSPTWQANGIRFSPANSCMQIGYTLASGRHTILAAAFNGPIIANAQIFRVSNTDNNFHFWQRRSGVSNTSFSPNTDLSGYINGAITNTANANAYNSFGATTSRTFATGTSSGTPTFFGDTANGQQWGDIGAFASIFNLELTTAEILSLHNLYKVTAGKGLNLP